MSKKTYNEIITTAKDCVNNVKKEYKTGVSNKWAYYFAQAILTPNNDVPKLKDLEKPDNPSGTHISQDISEKEYKTMAKDLITYCEKHKQLPDYYKYKSYQIKANLYTYMLAKVLLFYTTNKRLPSYVNANNKAFKKPTEHHNTVYDQFTKKYGKIKSIDEAMTIISNKFKYEGYFDDKYSNSEVIKGQHGNCTDLTQMLANIAEALGYTAKCVHVRCRLKGIGHVFLKLKKPNGEWFIRDPAAACGHSITNVWCCDGILLDENPDWWMSNKHR